MSDHHLVQTHAKKKQPEDDVWHDDTHNYLLHWLLSLPKHKKNADVCDVITTPDLSRLQSDDVGTRTSEGRESPQVGVKNGHLAEDTGFLIGDPRRVKLGCILWGKEVPAFPEDREQQHNG